MKRKKHQILILFIFFLTLALCLPNAKADTPKRSSIFKGFSIKFDIKKAFDFKKLDALKQLNFTKDRNPSKDSDFTKDGNPSKAPDLSQDLDFSKVLDFPKDLDFSRDFSLSKDSDPPKGLDLSKDPFKLEDFEELKDLDFSFDLESPLKDSPLNENPFGEGPLKEDQIQETIKKIFSDKEKGQELKKTLDQQKEDLKKKKEELKKQKEELQRQKEDLQKQLEKIEKLNWNAIAFTEDGTAYPYPLTAIPKEFLDGEKLKAEWAGILQKFLIYDCTLTGQDKEGNEQSFSLSFPPEEKIISDVRQVLFHHMEDWTDHFKLERRAEKLDTMVLSFKQETIPIKKTLIFQENYLLTAKLPKTENPITDRPNKENQDKEKQNTENKDTENQKTAVTFIPDPQTLTEDPSRFIRLAGGKRLRIEKITLNGENRWQGILVDEAVDGKANALILDNARLQNLHAKSSGGGMEVGKGNQVKITKTSFYNNRTEKNGGAIESASMTQIEGSNFIKNQAKGEGGAIFIQPFAYEDPIISPDAYFLLMTDENTAFSDNQAAQLYSPPKNAEKFTKLSSKSTSNPKDQNHGPGQVLNNADVNYAPGHDSSSANPKPPNSEQPTPDPPDPGKPNPDPPSPGKPGSDPSKPGKDHESSDPQNSQTDSTSSEKPPTDSSASDEKEDDLGQVTDALTGILDEIFAPFKRNRGLGSDKSSSRQSSSKQSSSSKQDSSSVSSSSSQSGFFREKSSTLSLGERTKDRKEDPPKEKAQSSQSKTEESIGEAAEKESSPPAPPEAIQVVPQNKPVANTAPETGGGENCPLPKAFGK